MNERDASSYPLIVRNAVSASFLDYVISIIENRLPEFVTNGTGTNRKFLRLDDVLPDGDKILFSCKQRLADHFSLGNYQIPPNLKDFLTYITEGGFVHPHTDGDLIGSRHVRINILVKQTLGCVPVVDGWHLDVEPGDAWLNLASLCEHATTPVVGPGYRSALSFGFQIDPSRCAELFEVHQQWARFAESCRAGNGGQSRHSEQDRL